MHKSAFSSTFLPQFLTWWTLSTTDIWFWSDLDQLQASVVRPEQLHRDDDEMWTRNKIKLAFSWLLSLSIFTNIFILFLLVISHSTKFQSGWALFRLFLCGFIKLSIASFFCANFKLYSLLKYNFLFFFFKISIRTEQDTIDRAKMQTITENVEKISPWNFLSFLSDFSATRWEAWKQLKIHKNTNNWTREMRKKTTPTVLVYKYMSESRFETS